MSDQKRYEGMDLSEENWADLTNEIARAWRKEGRLVGIIDEEAGGIIGYIFAAEEDHIIGLLNEDELR